MRLQAAQLRRLPLGRIIVEADLLHGRCSTRLAVGRWGGQHVHERLQAAHLCRLLLGRMIVEADLPDGQGSTLLADGR